MAQVLLQNTTNDEKKENKSFSQLFSKTSGIWKDYAIDGEKLRNEAWGIDKKTIDDIC